LPVIRYRLLNGRNRERYQPSVLLTVPCYISKYAGNGKPSLETGTAMHIYSRPGCSCALQPAAAARRGAHGSTDPPAFHADQSVWPFDSGPSVSARSKGQTL